MDVVKQSQRHKKPFTRARAEIWRVLTQTDEPLSPREIHSRLTGDNKADLATVYRGLMALKEAGLVREVNLGESFRRWESVTPGQHIHHITCQGCGRIEKLHFCAVMDMADSIEAESGYVLKDHHLECFGLCPACRATEAKK